MSELKAEDQGEQQNKSADRLLREVRGSDEEEERQAERRRKQENKAVVTEGIHLQASVNPATLSSVTSACRDTLFYKLRHQDSSLSTRMHTHIPPVDPGASSPGYPRRNGFKTGRVTEFHLVHKSFDEELTSYWLSRLEAAHCETAFNPGARAVAWWQS